MDMTFFLKGLFIGFAIAIPVGPIGILCIRRTMAYGRWSGMASGMCAAVADTLYGIVAAFGITLISNFLTTQDLWLKLLGGGFLLFVGMRTFLTKASETEPPTARHKTILKDFLSTLILTLTNPMTIVAYLAIFAGLGLYNIHHSYLNAAFLVGGVFVGSSIWWLIVSEVVTLFRKKVSQSVMTFVNRIAGLIITGFGIAVWLSLLV